MLFPVLRLAIGVAALAALFYFDFIDLKLLALAASSKLFVSISFTLLLSTIFIGAFRWKILLRALGVRLTFREALTFTFIGQFFSIFLPGAYGGDLIRGGLVYRINDTKLAEIMVSGFIDRVTGLFGLLVISLSVLVLIPSEFQVLIGFIVIIGILSSIFGFYSAIKYQHAFRIFIGWLPHSLSLVLLRLFNSLVGNLERYLNQKWSLFQAISLSIVQFVLVLEALYILGISVNGDSLSPLGYIVSGISGLFANAIPLSPGGLGLGEAAFGQVARLLETVPTTMAYSSIFLLMRALTLVIGVMGMIPFVLYRKEIKDVTEQNIEVKT